MKKQRRNRTDSESKSEDEREEHQSSQSQAGQAGQPITRMSSAQPAAGIPTAPVPHAPDPHAHAHSPPEATPPGEPVVPGYGSTDTEHSPETTTETQDHIQRALEGTDTTQDEIPDTVLDVLGEGGRSLEQPIQRALEERMDADFSNVRIHTGAKAAEAAEAIDAKAFTCGNDIVFNSGEYDTESPEGQHLLAHELAHVKQQNGGASISMMPKEGADLEIDPDPQLEREADEAAEQALSGEEPLVVNRMGTEVHIQRAAAGAPVKGAAGGSNLAERVSAIEASLSELEPLKPLADRTEELTAQLDTGDDGIAKKVGVAGMWGSIGAALTAAQHAGAEAIGLDSLLGNVTGEAHADAALGMVIAGTTAAKVTGGKEGLSALKERTKAWFSEWRAKSDEDERKSREETEVDNEDESVFGIF